MNTTGTDSSAILSPRSRPSGRRAENVLPPSGCLLCIPVVSKPLSHSQFTYSLHTAPSMRPHRLVSGSRNLSARNSALPFASAGSMSNEWSRLAMRTSASAA